MIAPGGGSSRISFKPDTVMLSGVGGIAKRAFRRSRSIPAFGATEAVYESLTTASEGAHDDAGWQGFVAPFLPIVIT
jgi:hypothetical protein